MTKKFGFKAWTQIMGNRLGNHLIYRSEHTDNREGTDVDGPKGVVGAAASENGTGHPGDLDRLDSTVWASERERKGKTPRRLSAAGIEKKEREKGK
jgi:hypothetical protein